MPNTHAYLRVQLAQEWYGIDVHHIIEVMHLLALNSLPDAPAEILGLMRLREQVIPVIDLRLHLNQSATYSLTTPVIVVKAQEHVVGLVIDEVDNLIYIDKTQILQQPIGVSRYVSSVARWMDELIMLLDVTRIAVNDATVDSINIVETLTDTGSAP